MSNKKQSSVELAVEKLEAFIPSGNQIAIYVILEQAKAMHKDEIKDAISVGYNMATPSEPYDNLHKGDKYYNEKFGGEQ